MIPETTAEARALVAAIMADCESPFARDDPRYDHLETSGTRGTRRRDSGNAHVPSEYNSQFVNTVSMAKSDKKNIQGTSHLVRCAVEQSVVEVPELPHEGPLLHQFLEG